MWQLVATLSMMMIEGSYLPQVYKLHKTKKAKDFNVMFPLFNAGGRLLAMMYTLSKGEYILAVGFLFGLSIRFLMLGQVLYYQRLEANGGVPVPLWEALGIAALFKALGSWLPDRPVKPLMPLATRQLCASAVPLQSSTCVVEDDCHKPLRSASSVWWQRFQAVVQETPPAKGSLQPQEGALQAAICQPDEACEPTSVTSPRPLPEDCKGR